MRLKTGINFKSLVRISGPYSYLNHEVGIPKNQGTHYRKDKDHSLDKVNREAFRETKEGQLKGKEHWLKREDTGNLSSYTVTH